MSTEAYTVYDAMLQTDLFCSTKVDTFRQKKKKETKELRFITYVTTFRISEMT